MTRCPTEPPRIPADALGPYRLQELVERICPPLIRERPRTLRRRIARLAGVTRIGYRYYLDPAFLRQGTTR